MGTTDLPPEGEVEDESHRKTIDVEVPFDGWLYRVDPAWPDGTFNTLGFRLYNGGSVSLPSNYGTSENESEWVVRNDSDPTLIKIEPVKEGSDLTVEVVNLASNQEQDLQIWVTISNFNPLLIGQVGGL